MSSTMSNDPSEPVDGAPAPRNTAEPPTVTVEQPAVPSDAAITAAFASTPDAAHDPAEEARPALRVRTSTLIWGLLLLALGGVTVAVVAGARIDPVVAAIVILAGLGLLLLVLAAIPRREEKEPAPAVGPGTAPAASGAASSPAPATPGATMRP